MAPLAKVTVTIDEAEMYRVWAMLLDAALVEVKKVVTKYGYKIRNDAVMLTPVDTGRLKSSWLVTPADDTDSEFALEIGTNVEYARRTEYGSPAITVTVKNKKVLANKAAGKVFGQTVTTPARAAKPMLRPALDKNRDAMIAEIRALLEGH